MLGYRLAIYVCFFYSKNPNFFASARPSTPFFTAKLMRTKQLIDGGLIKVYVNFSYPWLWTEVIKICGKWCLLNDVKTSIYKTTRNKRFDGSSYKFIYKNYLQNLKYNVNSGFIFHFILVGILSILILSVKNIGQGWGGFCLMEKIC